MTKKDAIERSRVIYTAVSPRFYRVAVEIARYFHSDITRSDNTRDSSYAPFSDASLMQLSIITLAAVDCDMGRDSPRERLIRLRSSERSH